MSSGAAGEAVSGRGNFPTTRWSVVINAGHDSEAQARAALETLCRQYWQPLYAFIRRQGRTHHEAQDYTQEFLARLLTTGGITTARPERGRFRTFLLTSLRNFLTNEWHRGQAIKRGGGGGGLALEFAEAEIAFQFDPADAARTPEQSFDRTWALGLLQRSVDQMRIQYEKTGRGELFAALAPLIWEDRSSDGFAPLAARLGMTTHAFTVALHRLRQRAGHRLRADVAQTVANEADVDAELRHLITAVS